MNNNITQNGKGSKPRNIFSLAFRDNYALINWLNKASKANDIQPNKRESRLNGQNNKKYFEAEQFNFKFYDAPDIKAGKLNKK